VRALKPTFLLVGVRFQSRLSSSELGKTYEVKQ